MHQAERPLCRRSRWPRPAGAVLTVLATLAAVTGFARPATAAAPAPAPAAALRVAVKIAEPFVIAGSPTTDAAAADAPASKLRGISIDLWDRVGARLGRETVYTVTTLEDMLEGVADGRFDAAIAAISVTAEREETLDLSHGYYTAGLGIAVPAGERRGGVFAAVRSLISPAFLSATGALALVLLVVGIVVWLAERRGNPEQFPRDPVRGLEAGFWFSAVTMTTVGYGDKAPVTRTGRLVSLVWMFTSIIVISAFTGAIASSLTAATLDGGVRGPEDLRAARVGTVAGTAADRSLRLRGVVARPYPKVADGLAAVRDGELDAFVHDRPLLQYRVSSAFPGELRLLESQFDLASYAIALPPDSSLREPVNRAVLDIQQQTDWSDVVQRYLGSRN